MAEKQTVTLMSGGDIGPVYEPTEEFAALIAPALKQADIRLGQCERTYSERGWMPQYSTGPTGQHSRLHPRMAGVWDAAVRAAETVDMCLGRVAEAVRSTGGVLVVTADHGNIEEMRDANGNPQTKHTTSPVPIVLAGEGVRGRHLRDGALSDVAPTLCELMAIPPGPEMTGRSLLD